MQAVFTGSANSNSSTVSVTVFAVPTLSLSAAITVVGSTAPVTVTATETGSNGAASGNVVTFSASAGVGGTFNPSTCVLSAGTCSVAYTPASTLAVGQYSNAITASFAASSATGYLPGSTAAGLGVNTQVDTLITFTGSGGANPGAAPAVDSLIQGNDGNFYGLTYGSYKPSFGGTFYRLMPSGVMTVLHTFNAGAFPYGGLIQSSDGSFYGVAISDGAYGYGTVFKLSPSGDLTVLHTFTGSTDQGYPQGPLIEGTDGNLYGLTEGVLTAGTVFRTARDGSGFATLHTFDYATEGYVYANPIQGSDGKLYGTLGSGPTQCGSVFSMTLDGTYSVLHAFNNSEGCDPAASLVQGGDGALYGVNDTGGAGGKGTVYKVSLSGTETTLYSFQGPEGAYPPVALLQGTDGNFYGTTSSTVTGSGSSAVSGGGTIFAITPAGVLTTLAQLPNGWDPGNSLLQGADGNLYGVDSGDYSSNYGHIFRVHPLHPLSAPVSLSAPATVTAGSTFALTYAALNAYSQTMQRCFATNSTPDRTDWTGALTATSTTATASLQASFTPGTYTYSLTCGGMESNLIGITVQPAPPTVAESFSPTSIAPAGTSTVTFTLININSPGGALSNIAFTDTLPGPLTIASPSAASTTCGGTLTANGGSNSMSFTGGSLAANAACTVKFNVTGTMAGTWTNASSAVSTSAGSTAAASASHHRRHTHEAGLYKLTGCLDPSWRQCRQPHPGSVAGCRRQRPGQRLLHNGRSRGHRPFRLFANLYSGSCEWCGDV